jgi:hypothetical protein
MKKIKKPLVLGTLLLAGVCAGPAAADPILTIQKYIPIPSDTANLQPNGTFNSFDISYADPVTGNVYIADRSNASVDIFSGSSLTYLGRATGFAGEGSITAPLSSSKAGADGVLTVTSGTTTTIYAGDAPSGTNSFGTLKVFSATTANPGVASLLQTLSTGGTTRVDEMAYSPMTHQVLAANNAETPAYGNLFTTTGPVTAPATLLNSPNPVVGQPANAIIIPASLGGIAAGGLEQPVWVANTARPGGGSFYISVPALAGTLNPGGLAEISNTGAVLRTIDFGTMGISSCSPTGLAVGASGNLMVGCGAVGSQAIVINPAGAGSLVKTFPGLGGTDELWYDPTTGKFYLTGNNGTNSGRFFDVVTDDIGGGIITQSVTLPIDGSAHSIAVDPLNGDVFVALAGNTFHTDGTVNIADPTCPLGCIAVYGVNGVPEPDSLPILLIGAVALLGLAVQRRRRDA